MLDEYYARAAFANDLDARLTCRLSRPSEATFRFAERERTWIICVTVWPAEIDPVSLVVYDLVYHPRIVGAIHARLELLLETSRELLLLGFVRQINGRLTDRAATNAKPIAESWRDRPPLL